MRRARLVFIVLAGCGGWNEVEGLTEADRQVIATMVLPAEAPPDPTNQWSGNLDAAVLGQALFFDTQIATPAGLSCASCHDASRWFIDTTSKPNNVSQNVTATGAASFTKRNSPSLVNVAHYRWWAWDGRSDSLWMQCGVAFERAMNGKRANLAAALQGRYLPLATQARYAPDAGVDADAAFAYKAMAAYVERLNSAGAPFDAFAEGNEEALSPEAKMGLKLFLGKAGCIECHSGPAFNGNASSHSVHDHYRSVGVAQRGDNVDLTDNGRADGITFLLTSALKVFNSAGPFNTSGVNRVASITARAEDSGLFRIKSLRQVAKTAPYMHAGQLATLDDVVHFYNTGGDASGFAGTRDRVLSQPLGLTPEEEQQLVAFLESLTGQPVPFALTCDSSAAPRKGATLCDGRVAP